MKVALAQINTKLGDVAANSRKIEKIIDQVAWHADILVFPEMTLPGYPLHDRIYDKNLLKAQHAAMLNIQEHLYQIKKDLTVILWFIDYAPNKTGSDGKWMKWNAAAILDGKNQLVYHKRLLPTYDVFYDKRYFQPGDHATRFPLPNGEVGAVTICEDMWTQWYDIDPVQESMATEKMKISLDITTMLKATEKWDVKINEEKWEGTFTKEQLPPQAKPTILFNISSSPYSVGKLETRLDILRKHVLETNRPFIYVNQVGGQDGHVYDGHSMVMNQYGEVTYLGKGFEEEVVIVDTKEPAPSLNKHVKEVSDDKYGNILEAIKLWTKDFLAKGGIKDVVIGVSWWIDSATSLYILTQILPKECIHAYYLPSKHSKSLPYVKELCSNLGVEFQEVSIDATVQTAIADIEKATGKKVEWLAYENIQAQVRWVQLMTFSRMLGGVVVNNSNRTEIAQGYATIYGDTIGFMSIIWDLLKNEVYALANYINTQHQIKVDPTKVDIIPKTIIERVASAELADNQRDPFDYHRPGVCEGIDDLFNGEDAQEVMKKHNLTKNEVDRYLAAIDRNEFKRKQSPTVIKLKSPSVGGGGRLYPIIYGK